MSDSLRPHGPQPTRLPCPWSSPGKNSRVGGHFLLQGIFLMQGLDLRLLCLLDWQVGSLPLLLAHSLSHVQLFVTPWTAARQASLSSTISRSLLKLMSVESVIPSNYLILSHPLLLLPSIFPSIRVVSKESALCIRWPKDWLQRQSFQ